MSRWLLLRATALLAVALLVAGPGARAADDAIPRPAGLEPEVAFWRRIFGEVTTRQALIHDNRWLNVVYEKVDIPTDATDATEKRLIDGAKGRYEQILRTLASGKRDDLSPEEARVKALWPAEATPYDFLAAAERVRAQQGVADRFEQGLIRSGQWRDHIREVLRKEGVPEDLAALPHVESSFNPAARSYVGAAGLWQFTGETGRRFMRIDSAVDERRDPFESSEAAARLLRYNYGILGSWPLAITAYNHGLSGMRRAVQAMGTDDIEAIVRRYDGPAFGFASRNFFVSFLAALDIDREPEKYFAGVQPLEPRRDLVVQVPDYVKVQSLERIFGVSHDTLRSYNPSLLPPIWEGAKYVPRGFRVRLPPEVIERAPAPEQALARLPRAERFDAQKADRNYRVKRGESYAAVASRYGVSEDRLRAVNGIKANAKARSGQVLKIPPSDADHAAAVRLAAATPAPKPAQKADQKAAAASKAPEVPGETPAPAAPPAPVVAVAAAPVAAPVPAAEPATDPQVDVAERGSPSRADPSDYFVAKDDTIEIQAAESLSHIAEWLDSSPDDVRAWNGMSRKRGLQVGQRLKLRFGTVDRDAFVARRVAYHRGVQDEFFGRYRVTDTTEHRLKAGESLWVLAQQKYKVPVWLLRQYNPDLDLNQVRPGTRVLFPRIEPVADNVGGSADVAQAR